MSLYSISGHRRNDEVSYLLNYANSLLEVYKRPPNEWHHSPYAALCHVKNNIRKIDVNIQENAKHLDAAESCLPTLAKISQNSNPGAFLRLKNGFIKIGHEPGKIRNYLFRKRYEKEQAAAARRLGLSTDRIASSEVKTMMEARINWLKNDNERLLPCRNAFKLCEAEVIKHVYANEELSDSSDEHVYVNEELSGSSDERSVRINEKLPNRNVVVWTESDVQNALKKIRERERGGKKVASFAR
ncbi:hypothetical protein PI93_021015 [Pandoraea fibrosis]|uniref:Uncharacterized protein n=1 Tax=Pandoraea fibrosis TaxID=1891094 RepID=A0ABX6HVB7_9BURK|nr:hypothetical protein [Pandoraea fibrosis]QHE91585.1 hypothetical protein PJ20_006985 [Pandoraea fibrosis]QHF14857.1 hypothetical protein PI93_021015 [Pandoraea fibrosis]